MAASLLDRTAVGSGGIGGVLDIATFGPRTGAVPTDGRVTFGAGSNSDLDNGVQLRTPVGRTVGLSLSSVAKRFTYRDLPPAYATPVDHAAVSSSGASNLKGRFDDGVTTVDGSALFSSDHHWPARVRAEPRRLARHGSAGRGPLAFSVDGSYVGQTYADDLQQSPLGAALLFGATVRATTTSGTSFSLVADNLTHY